MQKFKLVFRRYVGSNLARCEITAAGRDEAFEIIQDYINMGWFLTTLEMLP